MIIKARTGKRQGVGLSDDRGVGKLALEAESDEERKFLTNLYRLMTAEDYDREEVTKAADDLRHWLTDYPPFGPAGKAASSDDTSSSNV